MDIQKIFSGLTDTHPDPKPPRRKRVTQYYSKCYYNSRIKPIFDARWAEELKRPIADGEKRPSEINIRNQVTEEMWNNESETFQKWLTGRRDEDHVKEMAKHERRVEESKNAPVSPAGQDM